MLTKTYEVEDDEDNEDNDDDQDEFNGDDNIDQQQQPRDKKNVEDVEGSLSSFDQDCHDDAQNDGKTFGSSFHQGLDEIL